MKSIYEELMNSKVYFFNADKDISKAEWNTHKQFEGVSLMHLIKSCDTESTASIHIVRIMPNCEIGSHIHENSLEVHIVIEGEGKMSLEDKEYAYQPGTVALIPKGMSHKVSANEKGLKLIAFFSPSLL